MVLDLRTVVRDVQEMARVDPCDIQSVRFTAKERRVMIRALSRINAEPEDFFGIEHA